MSFPRNQWLNFQKSSSGWCNVLDPQDKEALVQRFSTGGDFGPKGHLAASGDIFGCHSWGESDTGISRVETKGAAKHPAIHRTDDFLATVLNVLRSRNRCLETGAHPAHSSSHGENHRCCHHDTALPVYRAFSYFILSGTLQGSYFLSFTDRKLETKK